MIKTIELVESTEYKSGYALVVDGDASGIPATIFEVWLWLRLCELRQQVQQLQAANVRLEAKVREQT